MSRERTDLNEFQILTGQRVLEHRVAIHHLMMLVLLQTILVQFLGQFDKSSITVCELFEVVVSIVFSARHDLNLDISIQYSFFEALTLTRAVFKVVFLIQLFYESGETLHLIVGLVHL